MHLKKKKKCEPASRSETRTRSMDAAALLSRFDGRSKLLVRALLCGSSGPRGALEVLRRQQRAGPGAALPELMESLCREQVTGPGCAGCAGCAAPLTAAPLLCLFPASFKQNLLCFVSLVLPALPRPAVLRLLRCLGQDPRPGPWVSALLRQLERSLGARSGEPLCSAACSRTLTELSRRLAGPAGTGGWAAGFSSQTGESEPQSASGSPELGTQRKRKSSVLTPDSDGEQTAQQSKRMKICGGEEQTSGGSADAPDEELQPAADRPCEELPQHIKDSVLQIKELLETQTEWEQSSAEVFKVLSDCNPNQVELLCSMLSFPDLPEQNLPKLCSSILTPSPDFSFSTAATLIRSLLLQKVLSLSEPASRCLVSAVTSLCSRYPRPMCHALIAPVLQEKNIGNPQAELLSRLIESCLDSHYRLLVLQMTFKIAWSEAVLSIIHSLLDSKPDFSEELFTQFTEQLVSQSSPFTKSVKFAKMMLTVLTKYTSHVAAAHKHSLHGCLMLNETFLKKSLQAALKRIT